jgi:hypothetical protein
MVFAIITVEVIQMVVLLLWNNIIVALITMRQTHVIFPFFASYHLTPGTRSFHFDNDTWIIHEISNFYHGCIGIITEIWLMDYKYAKNYRCWAEMEWYTTKNPCLYSIQKINFPYRKSGKNYIYHDNDLADACSCQSHDFSVPNAWNITLTTVWPAHTRPKVYVCYCSYLGCLMSYFFIQMNLQLLYLSDWL